MLNVDYLEIIQHNVVIVTRSITTAPPHSFLKKKSCKHEAYW